MTTSQKNFALASEIVDVRRNITLSDDEDPAKDFYIKISDNGGLKKNLVVKATRKINVKDASQKPVGDFNTVVGLVKIIHVEGSIAVAREFKLLPRTDQPMLDQIGIMTGDQIDLSESFIDTSKPVDKNSEAKKKVAATEPAVEQSVAANEATKITEPAKDKREPSNVKPAAPSGTVEEKLIPQIIKPESVQRDI